MGSEAERKAAAAARIRAMMDLSDEDEGEDRETLGFVRLSSHSRIVS